MLCIWKTCPGKWINHACWQRREKSVIMLVFHCWFKRTAFSQVSQKFPSIELGVLGGEWPASCGSGAFGHTPFFSPGPNSNSSVVFCWPIGICYTKGVYSEKWPLGCMFVCFILLQLWFDGYRFLLPKVSLICGLRQAIYFLFTVSSPKGWVLFVEKLQHYI